MPAISIVIPFHNNAETLAETLGAIRAQSFADWEAICIDDASSDGAAQIVKAQAEADARILYVTNRGTGPSAARNLGARLARAEIVAFCDADDIWLPGKLASVMDSFVPGIDACFGQIAFFQTVPGDCPTRSTVPAAPLTIAQLLSENAVCTLSNLTVRRGAFLGIGGFDPSLVHNEDLDLLIRLVGAGHCLQGINTLHVWYRTSPSGLSSNLAAMRAGRARAVASAAQFGVTPTAAAEAVFLRYLARRALRLDAPGGEAWRYTCAGLRHSAVGFLLPLHRGLGTAIASAVALALPGPFRRHLFSPLRFFERTCPMTKASIIVPAFNVAQTLPATLDGLLAQTFTDMEIIVVNDGSTDATENMAKHYATRHGIRLITQANRGLAGARNTGIAAARGSYVGFCDADDIWCETKLARHIAHLDASPEVGASYSGSILIDDYGHAVGVRQTPQLHGITAAQIFKRNPIGNGSAAVFRKAALQDIAYRPTGEAERDWIFDETFRQSEDIECWMRLALTTDWLFEGIPGWLTHYRVNAGGLSAALDRQLASWERMVAKLRPLHPAFFDRHEHVARAYQLRYLARRAVSNLDATQAWSLATRALASSLKPGIEEPIKTAATVAAAALLRGVGPAPILHATRIMSRARA